MRTSWEETRVEQSNYAWEDRLAGYRSTNVKQKRNVQIGEREKSIYTLPTLAKPLLPALLLQVVSLQQSAPEILKVGKAGVTSSDISNKQSLNPSQLHGDDGNVHPPHLAKHQSVNRYELIYLQVYPLFSLFSLSWDILLDPFLFSSFRQCAAFTVVAPSSKSRPPTSLFAIQTLLRSISTRTTRQAHPLNFTLTGIK